MIAQNNAQASPPRFLGLVVVASKKAVRLHGEPGAQGGAVDSPLDSPARVIGPRADAVQGQRALGLALH